MNFDLIAPMVNDDLLPEADACRGVGLTDTPGHRVWLRSLTQPVIAPDAAGRPCRRYRRSDLEAAAVSIAEGLLKHAFNMRHKND